MNKEVMDDEMYNEGDGEVVALTLGVDRLGTGAPISLFRMLSLNTSYWSY